LTEPIQVAVNSNIPQVLGISIKEQVISLVLIFMIVRAIK
jgi:hypothetical protein